MPSFLKLEVEDQRGNRVLIIYQRAHERHSRVMVSLFRRRRLIIICNFHEEEASGWLMRTMSFDEFCEIIYAAETNPCQRASFFPGSELVVEKNDLIYRFIQYAGEGEEGGGSLVEL